MLATMRTKHTVPTQLLILFRKMSQNQTYRDDSNYFMSLSKGEHLVPPRFAAFKYQPHLDYPMVRTVPLYPQSDEAQKKSAEL